MPAGRFGDVHRRQCDIVWGDTGEGRVPRPLLPAATPAAAAAALPRAEPVPAWPAAFGRLVRMALVQGT
jgi:hypothetical protein